jgi:hypothetical protein
VTPRPPVSWFLVEPGWRVLDAEGEEVGRVEEIVGDPEVDIFGGLAVSTGSFTKPRLVPSERVAEIRDGCVRLSLGRAEVDVLPAHEQTPPSLEIRPD